MKERGCACVTSDTAIFRLLDTVSERLPHVRTGVFTYLYVWQVCSSYTINHFI